MSNQENAAARRSTVTASAIALAHRSPSAGSAAANIPRRSEKLTEANPCKMSETASSENATSVRGSRVPSHDQSGRRSRRPPNASAGPHGPRWTRRRANHTQAHSSAPPASSERRPAKRASSGKRRGRIGGAGCTGRRDSLGPVGANSSGSLGT